MNSANIITATQKHTLFFISSNPTNYALSSALGACYDLHSFDYESNILSRLESYNPDIIILHSEKFDLSEEYFNHVPKIWLTERMQITERELLACYEKGIERVSFTESNPQLMTAKINGIIKSHRLKEYYIKKKILLGETCSQSKTKEKELIEQIYSYLSTSSSNEEFSIEKMSKDLAMSRTNFFSKVKSITGVSPSKMVMNYRLANASILLKENNENITEIAYKVGFSSTAYFTKCFKEKYGKKPSEIRKD